MGAVHTRPNLNVLTAQTRGHWQDLFERDEIDVAS
jgi:hypothetical protein